MGHTHPRIIKVGNQTVRHARVKIDLTHKTNLNRSSHTARNSHDICLLIYDPCKRRDFFIILSSARKFPERIERASVCVCVCRSSAN